MKRTLFVVALALFVAVQGALAGTHAKSVNVALIPNTTGAADGYGNWGGGAAGTLVMGYFPGYNITIVHPTLVTSAASLAQYDTVILYQYCNINTIPGPAFTTPLVQWLQQYGGKLMIWDSDSCGNQTSTGTPFPWLAAVGATFDRWSPGQTGSTAGSLAILDDNGFCSANSASPYYINTPVLVTSTDAVGDVSVVNENTVSPVWCALMRGVNVYGRSGYAMMYSKIGALTGAPDALILYCGLDTDYIGISPGGQWIQKLLNLQLAHGWGPPGSPEVADLNCQAPIGNLALTPATAVNPVTGSHTVTATVTRYNFSTAQTVPVPGITVNFLITSGPNTGATAAGVSGQNGQVSWTYSSAGSGTDVIQATATVDNVLKTATAQKTWCNPPTVTRTLAGNRAYYQITANSGCYGSLGFYVRDSASALVAGPYASGTIVRMVRGVPGIGPGLGTASVTIRVVGSGLAYAVDPLGSTSATVLCPP
ncbi:MAG: Ig-like domain-containing protein [Verrucomicrobiota bacterium]|nr:Ig-like domain-containing protein [Verrucomicrobiota bacterium]